jgi:Mechanosensitive ion channel, conserved TM helix
VQLAAVHIADSLQRALNSLIGFIPNLIGFLIILAVGYLIARVVKTVVAKLLEKVGVDRALHQSQAGQYVERVSPGAHPSRLIAAIAFWFIFIYAIAAAVGALKIPALTNFMANVQNYLPNVVAAVLIFVVGAALAGVVGGLADRLMGDTSTGRVARAVGPGLILAIVVFMVLTQLKIAPTIVTATYIALTGMLAVAGALAFGLGGREIAADMLRDAYSSGRQNQDQIKRDMQTGRDRAQAHANQVRASGHNRSAPGATPASTPGV